MQKMMVIVQQIARLLNHYPRRPGDEEWKVVNQTHVSERGTIFNKMCKKGLPFLL